jgi:anti-sigma factor RsiW
MATMPTAPATLGAHLERDRLEERAARLDRVITALRARVRAYDDGAVPPPLSHSLTDFEHELSRVQSRLATSQRASAHLRAARLAAHVES